jgi:hypothetical protein
MYPQNGFRGRSGPAFAKASAYAKGFGGQVGEAGPPTLRFCARQVATARQDFKADKLKLELQQGALQNASAAARRLTERMPGGIAAGFWGGRENASGVSL